jgi:hypothetical protein
MTKDDPNAWREEAKRLVAEIKVMRTKLKKLAEQLDETSMHKDTTIDQMTAETWQTMSAEEKADWTNYWAMKGQVSSHCLNCGFPTASVMVGCRACMPEAYTPG